VVNWSKIFINQAENGVLAFENPIIKVWLQNVVKYGKYSLAKFASLKIATFSA
jgi:hypothetical protein